MTALLNIKALNAYYGQVQALHGLEFTLNEGSEIGRASCRERV